MAVCLSASPRLQELTVVLGTGKTHRCYHGDVHSTPETLTRGELENIGVLKQSRFLHLCRTFLCRLERGR